MRHRSLSISIVLSLSACTGAKEPPADRVASSPPAAAAETSPATADSASGPPAPSTTSATADTQWVVTEHGIGPLHAGMTVAQARAVLPDFKIPEATVSGGCAYASANGLPSGVRVMVEKGRVVRAEVVRGAVQTSKGARTGDSEERIMTLYPNQVTVSPHKYTEGGHYLTVVPTAKADNAYRIIFETDGKNVLNYRGGIRPQVEYVEGCW